MVRREMMTKRKLRLAALSDIHWGRDSSDEMLAVLAQASEAADVLLICGDLTDYGLPDEAHLLVKDLHTNVRIPILAVLGNHDFESGQAREVRDIFIDAGVKLLDGECTEIEGVGFAGVSGFGGGFGTTMLNAWGEPLIKQFVQATVDEALKLEKALSSLHTESIVALLHYAPVRGTVEGEPLEIFPFLGSSRLEEPLNRYGVKVAFHGHAHAGTPEGRTSNQIPVYNVAVPVLRRAYPDAPPFRLFEVEVP
jgi:Icc-related predicted phosphoesterase